MNNRQTDLEIFLKLLNGCSESDYFPEVVGNYFFDIGGEVALSSAASIYFHVGYAILTSQDANNSISDNITHQKLVGLIWFLNEYANQIHLDMMLGITEESFEIIGYKSVLKDYASILISDLGFDLTAPDRNFTDVFLSWGVGGAIGSH